MAIAFPELIGVTALGVEVGLWYAIKRQDQTAADAAALQGTYERAAGQAYSEICAVAAKGFPFQSYSCPSNSLGCTIPSSGKMCPTSRCCPAAALVTKGGGSLLSAFLRTQIA